MELHKVSAQGSRVGWTPAHKEERTKEITQSQPKTSDQHFVYSK